MSAGSAIMLGLVRPRVPHVQLAGLRVEALHLVLAVHQDSTLFLEVYALTAVLVTMLPVAPALNAQYVPKALIGDRLEVLPVLLARMATCVQRGVLGFTHTIPPQPRLQYLRLSPLHSLVEDPFPYQP